MKTELDLRLQVSSTAPRQARREMATLAVGLPESLGQDLQLLVSELVANSLRHAELTDEDWIGLRANICDRTIRVEVSDPGRGFRHKTNELEPKSGLWILNALAQRWGIVRDETTRVWFETDLPQPQEESPLPPLAAWPDGGRQAARDLCALFGQPATIDEHGLQWARADGVEVVLRRADPPVSPSERA